MTEEPERGGGFTGDVDQLQHDDMQSAKTSSSSIQSGESGVFCSFPPEETEKKKKQQQVKARKLRRQTGTINIEEILQDDRPKPVLEDNDEDEDDGLIVEPELVSSTPNRMGSVPELLKHPPPLTPLTGCHQQFTLERRRRPKKSKKSLDSSFASNASVVSKTSSFLDKSTSWIINACDVVLSPRRKRRDGKATAFRNAATTNVEVCVEGQAEPSARQTTSQGVRTSLLPRSNSMSGSERLSRTTSDAANHCDEGHIGDSTLSTLKLQDLGRTFPDASTTTGNGGSPCPGASEIHPDAYFTIDARKLASKHSSSRRKLLDKKLLQCVKQFNLDPTAGIDMLNQNGVIDGSNPEDVASFLFREGRLSKKQIGAYIGSHHPLNYEVLRCFVRKHEFMNLILVQALRQFLWSFRLPGEAMQIDRIMERFAEHYCAQNPNLFEETDTCYIISFSIIMLNTALHNPNVRTKITLDQFVAQNRGINSGKDLPVDILEQIYRSIKEEPFRIPDENYDDLMYTFFSPEKEGWLLKEGGSWKSWKRRWFVLSDRCLYYFQHTTENVPKGIVPLENVKVRTIGDEDGKCFCFEVFCESHGHVKGCKTDSNGTVVQGNHRSYKMSASSEEERCAWVQAIQDSIKEHPFYDIISSKKAALRRKSLKHGSQHDIPQSSDI